MIGNALLAGACILAGTLGWSQQQKAAAPTVSTDIAATFAVERSQVVPSVCCFWFKGGGLDAAVTMKNGFGAAFAFNADHASNILSGVDANKLSFMGGPRYTRAMPKTRGGADLRYQIFAQGLVGGVHGFNGVYPATGGAVGSANALAVEAGGGFNLLCSHNWGVRLVEADYVRTALPNASGNVQNDFRLSFGITWHH
jgi:hypothetical protein